MSQAVVGYPELVASLHDAPIVARGDYDYFVHPLADGIPVVTPVMLQEAAAGLARHLGPALDDVDLLVTAEAMGLPLVTALATLTDKPFVVARKRAYGLPGERTLEQRTGYGTSRLYLNGVSEGMRVAIVDDVISTGGTLRALADGIRDCGANLVAVTSVFSKDPDLSALAADMGCPVSALVSCRVVRAATGKHVDVVGTDLRASP